MSGILLAAADNELHTDVLEFVTGYVQHVALVIMYQHLLHGTGGTGGTGGGNHSYGGFAKDEGSSSRRKTFPSSPPFSDPSLFSDPSPSSDPLTLCDAIMDTLSDKNTVDIGLYAMQ